jgi:hypothetical protein
MKTHAQDLTGHRSGLLTVTAPGGIDDRGGIYWECVCDCGRPAVVGDVALRHRTTRSCGCLRRARPIEVTADMAAKWWSILGTDRDPRACWTWPKSRDHRGYVRLSNTFHGEIPDSRIGLRDGVRCLTPAT